MSSRSLSPRTPARSRTAPTAGRAAALLLLAGFVGVHGVGCSILLPMAATSSNGRVSGRLLPAEDLLELDTGIRLRIADTSGTQAEGTYRGLAQDSDSAYAERYERYLGSGDAPDVPRLGEATRLVPRSMLGRVAVQSGRFAGFDYRGLLLAGEDGRVKRFEMARVDSMWREDGRGVSGLQLASLDANHELPSRTLLLVDQSAHDANGVRRTSRVKVPWESARQVQAVGQRTSVGTALLVGLALDGLVVYALTRPQPKQTTGCEAEPFPPGWPFMTQADLRHVHRVEQDFDRVAGAFVESGPALATR